MAGGLFRIVAESRNGRHTRDAPGRLGESSGTVRHGAMPVAERVVRTKRSISRTVDACQAQRQIAPQWFNETGGPFRWGISPGFPPETTVPRLGCRLGMGVAPVLLATLVFRDRICAVPRGALSPPDG
jgi:hypothetical protein